MERTKNGFYNWCLFDYFLIIGNFQTKLLHDIVHKHKDNLKILLIIDTYSFLPYY